MKLPLFGAQTKAPAHPALAPIPADATVILMVDDEPAVRGLFAQALRRDGYHVLEAGNGAEALDLTLKAGRVDLVVTDVVMPVMRGPELAQRLREHFPGLKFIFVSGYLVAEDLGEHATALQKPFKQRDLMKKVYDVIGPPRQAAAM
jgi:two-component system cell cycle sensor histidine kinase/response regulator CckA